MAGPTAPASDGVAPVSELYDLSAPSGSRYDAYVTSRLISTRDFEFLLNEEWLEVPSMWRRPRFAGHSHESFDFALGTADRVTTEALRHV
jgi:hypothetical protein